MKIEIAKEPYDYNELLTEEHSYGVAITGSEPEARSKGGKARKCGSCRKWKSQCECGRPTVMTPEVLKKLRQAFMYGYTDEEACLYAGISAKTLYTYCNNNPRFAQEKEELKLTPNLYVKQHIVTAIKGGDLKQANWWGERKMSHEFSPKSKVEHSGGIAGMGPESEEQIKDFTEFKENFKKQYFQRIINNKKNKGK